MLVVLETFCELPHLKNLRKAFYLKKEKTEDQLNIVDHDHLSFATVCEQTGPGTEERGDLFLDGDASSMTQVPPLTPDDNIVIR